MSTKVPHNIPAKDFIDWVNRFTTDEAKRCRILLAELLLRSERSPSMTNYAQPKDTIGTDMHGNCTVCGKTLDQMEASHEDVLQHLRKHVEQKNKKRDGAPAALPARE